MPILNGPPHGVCRWSIAAVVTVAAVVGAASTASAHELINGQARCTGLTAGYAGFADSQKPITYRLRPATTW